MGGRKTRFFSMHHRQGLCLPLPGYYFMPSSGSRVRPQGLLQFASDICLIFFFFFCGIMDGTRALWTRALCMLGRYSPTELYPQLLNSLDYIQHLIDKDQRKEMPPPFNFSNPGVAFHFYPFTPFL